MKRFTTCLLTAVFALALAGCRKEDPNPELLDPIYGDLLKASVEMQKSYDDEKKKQEDLRISIDKAEPNTIELRNLEKELIKSLSIIVSYQQDALYFKIRAQRRLLIDRITYKEAFAKNQKWPDPHEYSEYLVNSRLQNASRNWNTRVPKLQDRLVKAQAKASKEATEGKKAD